MLNRIAQQVDGPLARFGFIFVGVALLAAIVPIAPYALSALNVSYVDWTKPTELVPATIVAGTLLGVFAAWARVFISVEYLGRHPRFRLAISIGLIFGILATASVAMIHFLKPDGSAYLLCVCLIASVGATLLLLGTVSR